MRAILIMLAALPLLAADRSNANFSGRVLAGEGSSHIAGAIVTVATPAGFVSSVTTSEDGGFSFGSLPAGEYNFRVTAHGYAIYERQVTVAKDAGVKELDIRMLVPANKQTVSVAELRRTEAERKTATAIPVPSRGY